MKYQSKKWHVCPSSYLKKQKKGAKVPMPMKKMVIDNIIYPVQTKRGLKWGKQNKK